MYFHNTASVCAVHVYILYTCIQYNVILYMCMHACVYYMCVCILYIYMYMYICKYLIYTVLDYLFIYIK